MSVLRTRVDKINMYVYLKFHTNSYGDVVGEI